MSEHPAVINTHPVAKTQHVTILLGLYNGADVLRDQLDSLTAQTHGDWSLIVSDDGCSDGSPDVVREFERLSAANTVKTIEGPRTGWAANYLSLLVAAGGQTPFVAFCDQDDVWLPQKLERALARLSTVPEDRPALYCGRTIITDEYLEPLRKSLLFQRAARFENALVQSIAGGNTMVLNRPALDILQAAAPFANGIVSHDWWAYQMISGAGGVIEYDAEPMVLYRQHARNLVGANDTMHASVTRIWKLLQGRFKTWNDANLNALRGASFLLTTDALETLERFYSGRCASPLGRLLEIRKLGIYRQTRRGSAALWMAALLGKL